MESKFGQRMVGASALWVAMALTITACSDSTGTIAGVAIVPASKTIAVQTSASGFSTLQIPITITNTSSQVIAYSFCGSSLEQNTTQGWRMVYTQFCALLDDAPVDADASPPIPFGPNLAPGETGSFTMVVPVRAQPLGPVDQSIRGEPGEYRVRVLIATEFIGRTVVLPHDATVSETFNVVP